MSTKHLKSPRDRIAENLKEIPRSGIRDFFDIVSSMKDVISLGVGEPGFTTPWHVREASVFALEKGATGYTSNLGLLKLRQAIATYLAGSHNLNYDAQTEILITVGVSEAMDLAIRACLNPGDEVIYHEPCYVSYRPLIQLAHAVPVAVETKADNGFQLTAEALKAAITPKTRMVMLNYPNNPTGAALGREAIEEIAQVIVDHDLLVVTDEIYGELTYEGEHFSIAALPGMKERTIFMHGFSKAWAMTGFRLGYACAPPELTEAMMKIHQYTMLCAPILSQEAAVEALQTQQDVEYMKGEYTKHRNYMWAAFQEMGLECRMPDGAFYAFPRMAEFGLSAYDFAMKLLDEEQVAVVPGTRVWSVG